MSCGEATDETVCLVTHNINKNTFGWFGARDLKRARSGVGMGVHKNQDSALVLHLLHEDCDLPLLPNGSLEIVLTSLHENGNNQKL